MNEDDNNGCAASGVALAIVFGLVIALIALF